MPVPLLLLELPVADAHSQNPLAKLPQNVKAIDGARLPQQNSVRHKVSHVQRRRLRVWQVVLYHPHLRRVRRVFVNRQRLREG